MKNSINTDIFVLNIYSLTNLSPFFNGKSVNQNFLTCPYLSAVGKFNPPVWAGKQPLGVEMHKRLWGVPGPSGTGTIKPENQGGLVPSGTAADGEHKADRWAGGSSRLTFLSWSLSVWYHSTEAESGGKEYAHSITAPPQIGTDSPNTPIQACNSDFEGLLDSRHPVTA